MNDRVTMNPAVIKNSITSYLLGYPEYRITNPETEFFLITPAKLRIIIEDILQDNTVNPNHLTNFQSTAPSDILATEYFTKTQYLVDKILQILDKAYMGYTKIGEDYVFIYAYQPLLSRLGDGPI